MNVITDVSTLNNKELLDEICYAYETMHDYVYRSDWVKWSPEAEDKAIQNFTTLQNEALRRMKEV